MTHEPQGEVLYEEGEVLAVLPREDDRQARVRVRLIAGDHCEGCPAKVMCRPGEGDRRTMDVTDPVGVSVGDRVQVAVPGGAVLKASFLVYGLPLLLLLIGVWLGTKIWSADDAMRDLWSFLLGAGLAAAAVPWVRQVVQRAEAGGGQILEPKVVGTVTVGMMQAED